MNRGDDIYTAANAMGLHVSYAYRDKTHILIARDEYGCPQAGVSLRGVSYEQACREMFVVLARDTAVRA